MKAKKTKTRSAKMLGRIAGGCFGCVNATPLFSRTASGLMRIRCLLKGNIVERDECESRKAMMVNLDE